MAEEKQQEKANPLESRVRDLEAALKASRAALPVSLVPEHGAGYGDEVAETWSQADQEEARAEE
jgi:hypothetical protein